MTARTKKRILALTAKRKSQKEIASLLDCSRASVYRVQRKSNLQLPRTGPRIPVLSPTDESAILAMLAAGVGTAPIADKLGIPQSRVRAFAESGFGSRRVNVTRWRELAPDVQNAIDSEIREHLNHATDIADRFGISDKVVLARARKVLNCPKFLTGKSRPFTSHFPQKELST